MKVYQTNFSQMQEHITATYCHNKPALENMAKKMEVVCREFSEKELKDCVCCEIGSSTGVISNYLADVFRNVYAFDIDLPGVYYA